MQINTVTWLFPVPSCPLPCFHQARAHTDSAHTDVRATFKLYDVGDIRDDFEKVEQTAYLEQLGDWK